MKSRTLACNARCSSVKEKNIPSQSSRERGWGPATSASARETQHELGDDVALDLGAAAPDGLRPRPQERALQILAVEPAAGDLVAEAGDVGVELADVLVGLA